MMTWTWFGCVPRRGALLLLFALLDACGGGTATTIAGSVGGKGLTVEEAIYDTNSSLTQIVIFLVDHPGLCAGVANDELDFSPNAAYLGAFLRSQTAPAPPGTYSLASNAAQTLESAGFWLTDANCAFIASSNATGGGVVVSAVDFAAGSHARGSLDLQFGNGALKGDFDAQYCPGFSHISLSKIRCNK